jgi:uncharacterized membrane protein
MSLRKLYILWSIAACVSLGIGILFYLIAMHLTYGNFSGHEDFDGLVYFIESIIVIVLSTGVLTALSVSLVDQKANDKIRRKLALRIFYFYTFFALFCVATFKFAFIYLNPISLVIFACIPKFAWDSINDRSKSKKQILVFVGMFIVILLLWGLTFLGLFLSDPYNN